MQNIMKFKINTKIKGYTAIIPKTYRATKKLGKNTLNKSINFLNSMRKSIKHGAKKFDKKASKRIRSITKRIKRI